MQLVCQLRHRQRHLGDFVRGLRLISSGCSSAGTRLNIDSPPKWRRRAISDMLTRRMRTFSASPIIILKQFVLLIWICPACQAAKHLAAAGTSATYSPTFGRQAACQKGGSSSTTVQPPNVSCAGGGIRSQPYCRPYLANLRALRNFCHPLISPLAIPLSTISRISRVS